jgi:OmpA-OmpF porin, OOP family
MRAQHPLLCLAIAATAVLPAPAVAQSASTPLYSGPLKEHWWGRSALGLSLNRSEFRLPCSSVSGACEELSVVGKASVGVSPFNLFGKVGSTSVVRTYALGADSGFGLSFGAGVSWEISPRASATVAWDTYDLRGSAPVRSTSLGLQWRY